MISEYLIVIFIGYGNYKKRILFSPDEMDLLCYMKIWEKPMSLVINTYILMLFY